MKKSKLEQVLRRKVRIKITRRKRGKTFLVLIPSALAPDHIIGHSFRTKREALVWLYTRLRCLDPLVITVK